MRFIPLVIAAALAIFAGFVALQLPGKSTASSSNSAVSSPASLQFGDVPTVGVLVARAPIAAGAVLDSAMIDVQPWPKPLVPEGAIEGKASDLTGKVARASFAAREPLVADKLGDVRDPGFLASKLGYGMRAVTIATTAVTGVAGYVFPGDRVDILFTHDMPQTGHRGAAHSSAKPSVAGVLAADVRVLAVNSRNTPGKEFASSASSVTVEVNETQAQAFRLAEKVGTLSLALRPTRDEKIAGQIPPTMLTDLLRTEQEQGSDTVTIVRGANSVDNVTVAGKSVSRQENVTIVSNSN